MKFKREFRRTLIAVRIDAAIRTYYDKHGAGAKVAELARALGVRPSGLYVHLRGLEQLGRLRPHVGRGPRRLIPHHEEGERE